MLNDVAAVRFFIVQVYSPGADDMMAQVPGETSQYSAKHGLYSDIYYGGMNLLCHFCLKSRLRMSQKRRKLSEIIGEVYSTIVSG